ncbi:hypothetical protein SCHPADRAFT_908850 [Schizopora paradoxa]|uniref:Uncharacterized protein n=1 Tax=Schizopora paradoxa TaxID=27342 RepID=A0A0H2RTI5_9AGAM|nr:hypothetical protein SCHPADRAFT_908850 [Schizopora paradoxa]
MVEHLYALQRQLLPSVLGAIRLANPGTDVQIFWETTGKTQEQMLSLQKPQRHFDDFPHIDIVGLPRNRLSPLFIKQSVELFLNGNGAREFITQHVVLVAMSDPIDDPFVLDAPSSASSPSSEDHKWDTITNSMIQNRIILHLIANPAAKLLRLFELYRKTMQAQSRQEVVPWHVTGEVQCKCHLSGRPPPASASSSSTVTVHEWPEVISETFDPSNLLRRPKLPNRRGHSFPPSAAGSSINRASSPDDGLIAFDNPGPLPPSASLVTRMQAIHGLAKRRPERPRPGHSAFFRDDPPKSLSSSSAHSPPAHSHAYRERGPAANRERLRNVRPIDTGQAAEAQGSYGMAGGSSSSSSARSPTSTTPMYTPNGGYTDAALALTSSLTTSMSAPPQTLYQMPSPGSDASSNSSKSPLWPSQHTAEYEYEYTLRDDMLAASIGYGPQMQAQTQASSSLSPQLTALSTGNLGPGGSVGVAGGGGGRALGTSSLTDTGLIANTTPPFTLSSWLGPPPGSYASSVPYGVPVSSSTTMSSAPAAAPPPNPPQHQMLSSYPPGSMPPPSAYPPVQMQQHSQHSQHQQHIGRPTEKARQHSLQINPFGGAHLKGTAMGTGTPSTATSFTSVNASSSTSTSRLPPVSNALAAQLANANALAFSSGSNRPRTVSIPEVVRSAATATASATTTAASATSSIMDGNTPFLFDPVAEAQNSIRLHQAILTLDNQKMNQEQSLAAGGRSTNSVSPPGMLSTAMPRSPTQMIEQTTLSYPPRVASYPQLSNETIAQGVSYPY